MNNKLNENISKCVNLCEHHIQKYEEDKRSEAAEEKIFEKKQNQPLKGKINLLKKQRKNCQSVIGNMNKT